MPTFAATMRDRQNVRGLILGDPGSGKTTAIGHLVEHGYKVRHLSFDGLLQTLRYVDAKALDENYLVKILRDDVTWKDLEFKSRKLNKTVETTGFRIDGIPSAFSDAVRIVRDGWQEGEKNLGTPDTWGPDTVLVFDQMTDITQAAVNQRAYLNGYRDMTIKDMGEAYKRSYEFLQTICQESWRCHVLVLSHFKRLRIQKIRDANAVALSTLEGKVSLERADDEDQDDGLLDTYTAKRYPNVFGVKLPEHFGASFDFIVQTFQPGHGRPPQIRTQSTPDVDLKCPCPERWAAGPLAVNELHKLLDYFRKEVG